MNIYWMFVSCTACAVKTLISLVKVKKHYYIVILGGVTESK